MFYSDEYARYDWCIPEYIVEENKDINLIINTPNIIWRRKKPKGIKKLSMKKTYYTGEQITAPVSLIIHSM